MRSHYLKALSLSVGLFVASLAMPAAAHAQDGPLKLQVGVSVLHIDFNGIGASGAIVKPLGPKGPGNLEALGGAEFHDVDGLKVVAFGGGVRLLLKPNGKMTPFVQGIAGITHSEAGTDFGVAPGGGVSYAYSDKMNLIGDFSLAILHTDFDTRMGFRVLGGIEIPIGQK